MYYQKSTDENAENHKPLVSPPDQSLIIITIFLIVIGIMAVFSAGSATAIAEGNAPGFYLTRHFIGLIVGIFACLFFIRLDYKRLKGFAIPFTIFVIILLFLTKFSPLGVSANGAQRWLNLGIRFQPSEFSKLALILCLAEAFSKDVNLFDKEKYIYYALFIVMLGLILIQPNLSMTMLLCFCAMAVYFCAGGSTRLIMFSFGGAAILAPFALLKDYQLQRLRFWLHPELDPIGAGYNIIQSLVAFASGGLFGVGYGNSKQKLSWLPEGHTDFIFSVWAEEFGFIGCLFLIGLFFALVRRGCIIATRCPDRFGRLLAFGITFSLGVQAFINMGVASAFLPASGVPLPFISFGSSSLVVSLSMIGILLNISRKKIQKITPQGLGYE